MRGIPSFGSTHQDCLNFTSASQLAIIDPVKALIQTQQTPEPRITDVRDIRDLQTKVFFGVA